MQWLLALAGGMLIGAAASLLLLTHGRVAGISGIVGSLLQRGTREPGWRLAFVAGLVVAGTIATQISPSAVSMSARGLPVLVLAGGLVGYGTQLGSGCTSGHGVCGISRLSLRSLVAVATFMTTGAITVTLARGLS